MPWVEKSIETEYFRLKWCSLLLFVDIKTVDEFIPSTTCTFDSFLLLSRNTQLSTIQLKCFKILVVERINRSCNRLSIKHFLKIFVPHPSFTKIKTKTPTSVYLCLQSLYVTHIMYSVSECEEDSGVFYYQIACDLSVSSAPCMMWQFFRQYKLTILFTYSKISFHISSTWVESNNSLLLANTSKHFLYVRVIAVLILLAIFKNCLHCACN